MIHKPSSLKVVDIGIKPPYFHWQCELRLTGCHMSAEELYRRLPVFFQNVHTSNTSKVLFAVDNWHCIAQGADMVILQPGASSGSKAGRRSKLRLYSSALHFEYHLTHEHHVCTNMAYEMTALISLLCFMYHAGGGNCALPVTITMDTNANVLFDPKHSLVRSNLLPIYCLRGKIAITRLIHTLDTSELAALSQEIMQAFTHETTETNAPVLIDTTEAFFNINYLKRILRLPGWAI